MVMIMRVCMMSMTVIVRVMVGMTVIVRVMVGMTVIVRVMVGFDGDFACALKVHGWFLGSFHRMDVEMGRAVASAGITHVYRQMEGGGRYKTN
jgi:hypothetical protein